MKKHIETCIIAAEVQDVFNLVADIESYPEFLPWCEGARITETIPGSRKDYLIADLVVAFGSFREIFPSEIVVDKIDFNIEIFSSENPFKVLHGKWDFKKINDGCQVDFEIKFEFKSKILDKLIGLVFYQSMKKIVKAFQRRAIDLKSY